MNVLIPAAVSILATEAIVQMPLGGQIRAVRSLLGRVHHVIRSPAISDCWKERVLPVYALRLARHSLLIGFMLGTVSVGVFGLLLVWSVFAAPDAAVLKEFMSVRSLIVSLAASGAYLFVRFRIVR